MADSLKSLIGTGTKLWLDSIDPDLVVENRKRGATGATSNPIIIADLIKTGRFDSDLERLVEEGLDDEAIAWQMTDQLVQRAQQVFQPAWSESRGNDGYVSFELDPLLEDAELGPPHEDRVVQYLKLGEQWSAGHDNRMIKVPATPAGLAALEDLAAAGVVLNVTLIFSQRQYREARDAVWRGAQRSGNPESLKSVYSIFVSRLDVYTEQHVPELSEAAQGQVGIVNAKRLWLENREFWQEKKLPLAQEIIFASTGTKKPEDPPWKYVAAFAGSDIQTNPPATNQAVLDSGREFSSQVATLPPADVLDEIDQRVDFEKLEQVLMAEGIRKFAEPQKALLELIASKRKALCGEAI
jgi:transaldolase